jgi:predicted TPR repeat methyltransferase
VGDAIDHLRTRREFDSDLILAADLLVYIGDLTPLFLKVARVLAVDGLFAFTAESQGDDAYVIGSEMRYAHSRSYVEKTASQAGLSVRLLKPDSTRSNKGVAVPSLIVVLLR